MNAENRLTRFLDAQNQTYLKALSEISQGRKQTHWMWFVFPQLKGLGHSEAANFYGISGIEEAGEFLSHPVLGKHLIAISTALLQLDGKSAFEIFGTPDDVKLRSSMTLFANVPQADPVFEAVLQKYFAGLQDEQTLALLTRNKFSNDVV